MIDIEPISDARLAEIEALERECAEAAREFKHATVRQIRRELVIEHTGAFPALLVRLRKAEAELERYKTALCNVNRPADEPTEEQRIARGAAAPGETCEQRNIRMGWGCKCHGMTFCPDEVCVGYENDVPIYVNRNALKEPPHD